jgi:S-formylglutathione hydrolase
LDKIAGQEIIEYDTKAIHLSFLPSYLVNTMSIKEVAKNKCFGGHVIKYEHRSEELDCDIKFNVFLPQEATNAKVPAIYFLSGLTCTEDNFIQKSGAMAEAAKHGIALIAPDTSPRIVGHVFEF